MPAARSKTHGRRTPHSGSLVGWSEPDLEACLGAPNWQNQFGDADILTYAANSTSSKTVSRGVPFVIGLSGSGGGYCHAVFTLKDRHVTKVEHVGETDALMAPDAYCAQLMRNCVDSRRIWHPHLQHSTRRLHPAIRPMPDRRSTNAKAYRPSMTMWRGSRRRPKARRR